MAPITFTCPTCGQPFTVQAEAADQTATCPQCGEPLRQGQPPAPVGKPASGLATISLILGILSLFSCYLSPLFAVPAIICGRVARNRARRDPDQYQDSRRALTGLGLGYFALLMLVLMAGFSNGIPLELVPLPQLGTPTFEKAREGNCAANLIQIGLACKMYADDCNGTFPPDFKTLWRERYLDAPKIYICSSTKTSPAESVETLDAHCDYLYLAKGLTRKQVSNPNTTVLACDRTGNHTRTWFDVLFKEHAIRFDGQGFWNIVFADGHVAHFSGDSLPTVARESHLILPAESAAR